MSCMFLISFHFLLHLFALLDCKENHQKDLTNNLFFIFFFHFPIVVLNGFQFLYMLLLEVVGWWLCLKDGYHGSSDR